MDYADLQRDILEEFAAFPAVYAWQPGYRVVNPDKHREAVRNWQILHPARVRELAREASRRWRRRQGAGERLGPPPRVFVDQHGNRYEGLKDAVARTGIPRTTIHSVLTGKRPEARGFVFRYA